MPIERTECYEGANRGLRLFLCGIAATLGASCQEAPGGAAESGNPARHNASLLQLEPTSDSHSHTFEVIAGIRELSDGRVLVSDERATQLLVADFAGDSVHSLGGRGQGPGEYRQVARLWAMSGDTTLHKEPYSVRLIVLSGSEAIATLGGGDSAVLQLGAMPILGVDSVGRAVVAPWHRGSGGRVVLSDSLHLVRVHWKTGIVDTISRVQSEAGWSEAAGRAGGGPQAASGSPSGSPGGAPGRSMFSISVSAPDQVAVLPSGWVAIVRAEPYRVDWCSPAGVCTDGPVLQAENPPFTDEYKQLYLRRAALTFTWPPTQDVEETTGWPRVLPPFSNPASRLDGSAVIAAPGDRILIQRMTSTESMDTHYDLVGRVDGLVGWIEIPPADRVVGFGAEHVYVARTTEDGWQLLRRHPWSY